MTPNKLLSMNKYNKTTIEIDGSEVDLSKRAYRPKEENGKFATFDSQEYYRDPKGCIRKVKKEVLTAYENPTKSNEIS